MLQFLSGDEEGVFSQELSVRADRAEACGDRAAGAAGGMRGMWGAQAGEHRVCG